MKNKNIDIMIGYGELSSFKKVKKDEEVMTRYGNIIKAGKTKEEERKQIEDDLDDILYSKPIALVKKIQRRLQK